MARPRLCLLSVTPAVNFSVREWAWGVLWFIVIVVGGTDKM